MELRQIRHFLAVSQHGHFGRASAEVHITQQALSYSISELEKELGFKLFERGHFGAETTMLGKAFEQRAMTIMAEIDTTLSELHTLAGGEKGHVRFGVSSVVASGILPRVVTQFAKHRPMVGLSTTVDLSETLYEQLSKGALEFVVSTPLSEPEDYPNLSHDMVEDNLNFDFNYLVMRRGHPLTKLDEVTPKSLSETPWILPEALAAHSGKIMDFFRNNGVAPPTQVVRTDSFLCAKAMIAQTDYIALMGREPVRVEVDAGIFVGMRLPNLNALLKGYIVYRKRGNLQPAAKELLHVFKKVFREGMNSGTPGDAL